MIWATILVILSLKWSKETKINMMTMSTKRVRRRLPKNLMSSASLWWSLTRNT